VGAFNFQKHGKTERTKFKLKISFEIIRSRPCDLRRGWVPGKDVDMLNPNLWSKSAQSFTQRPKYRKSLF